MARNKGNRAAPRNDVGKLDANQLLQDWKGQGLSAQEQIESVRFMLAMSKPLIEKMAEHVGNPKDEGAITDADDRKDAVQAVIRLGRLMGESFKFHEKRVAKAMGMAAGELKGMMSNKKGAKDDDGEPVYTAGGWIQKHLIELLYDPERMRTGFAVRFPDGHIEDDLERVIIDGVKYVPFPPNSTITKKTVLLPSAIGEELQEEELLDVVRAHIKKYFDFGSDAFFEELTPFYVLFTYLYDAFMEVSYLRGLGDYGTGKTRFLKAAGKICYRPVYMSGGSSAASIYHLLDQYRGTLVLNEADFGESDEASIIAKILNGGTERDESVTRMRKDSQGNFDVEAFNVYGPKIIVTRSSFKDKAIESRCLTMEMVPFSPHPRIPQSLPPEFELESMQIRNVLTAYRLKRAEENITIDQSVADKSLEPRLNQITMSLLSTVKSTGTREKIHAFLRDYNERTRADRKESKTARVIEGLILANSWGPVSDHPSDKERVYLKEVAAAVNMLMDAMRHKMGEDEDEEESAAGKKRSWGKMTSRSVSGILKSVCQLRVRETTDGLHEYRGTNEIVWDEARVRALCLRWGVPWKERGTEQRPYELRPEAPGITKAREDWRQTGMKDQEEA